MSDEARAEVELITKQAGERLDDMRAWNRRAAEHSEKLEAEVARLQDERDEARAREEEAIQDIVALDQELTNMTSAHDALVERLNRAREVVDEGWPLLSAEARATLLSIIDRKAGE